MITSHMNGYVQEASGQAMSHRERAVDCPGEESSIVKSPHCSAHMERIQHYQEELRKRKEEEGRGKHDIDPNASLRLKKLAQNPKVGIDNPTFEGKEKATKDTCSLDPLAEVAEVLQALKWAQHCLHDAQSQQDVELIMQLVVKEDFRNAFTIYSAVAQQMAMVSPTSPLTAQAEDLCMEVQRILQASHQREGVELKALLTNPHLQAHDTVAGQEIAEESAAQYLGETVKLVRLQKARDTPLKKPLLSASTMLHHAHLSCGCVRVSTNQQSSKMPVTGATVRNDMDSVLVSRVVKGGAAEKSGLLSEGDEILEINGISIRGKHVNEVHDLLQQMQGTLTFLLIPSSQIKPATHRQTVMHVRAYLTTTPPTTPSCRVGSSACPSRRGNPPRHQPGRPQLVAAYRDGDEDNQPLGTDSSMPGMPREIMKHRKSFQQQRETLKRTITDRSREQQGKIWYAKKEMLTMRTSRTYEEMSLYHQPANRKRPIALIGPTNSGHDELRRRLLSIEPEKFAVAVPYTTRNIRIHERNGREYHFVSRPAFETDLAAGKFIESGDFGKNLYGTSTDSVRHVVNSGRICLLCLHTRPEDLKEIIEKARGWSTTRPLLRCDIWVPTSWLC
ncbi:hypothetical protein KUCAC02_019579 [Chaenocephalus aceratus]|uniref:Uncharacterized protein n=1 Tax=Chaenocephalus aceratus TaxID=36190 RepID=A0ACB9VQ68_CHAAC|nr:hypothetical protein KUCAC02_019579 [Chaenocephalus aceratus]